MAARLKGPRAWIAGLIAAFLLLPGVGYAQAGVRGCWMIDGSDKVVLNLPPSVSFDIGAQPPAGMMLYRSREYHFRYRCLNNLPGMHRVVITKLADYATVQKAMDDASMELWITYGGVSFNPLWNPDPTSSSPAQYVVGDPYQGDTGERDGFVMMILNAKKWTHVPLRSYLPPTTAFKLMADDNAVLQPGVFFNTTPTRFQFIPNCIGVVGVDNTVAFDTVLTTASYNGKLPQAKPFNVTMQINSSAACPGLDRLVVAPSSSGALDEFFLPTTVSFLPQSGERTDVLDEALFLKNADGQENGLKLTITNAANQKVRFGPVPIDQYGITNARYVGNVGPTLYGTKLSATQAYTAHLERTGAELKTGS
uniref:hypothetical protein n=1 Tax=Achromobacter insuavis TaxID=1287735 RepID=UPI0035A062A7